MLSNYVKLLSKMQKLLIYVYVWMNYSLNVKSSSIVGNSFFSLIYIMVIYYGGSIIMVGT